MAGQGALVNDMRYLASVVTQCFTAFGELLALHKRFAELTGGITRHGPALHGVYGSACETYARGMCDKAYGHASNACGVACCAADQSRCLGRQQHCRHWRPVPWRDIGVAAGSRRCCELRARPPGCQRPWSRSPRPTRRAWTATCSARWRPPPATAARATPSSLTGFAALHRTFQAVTVFNS